MTEGMLNTERGWKGDIDATLFVLNWQEAEEDQIFFVKKTGTTSITQLNKEREEFTPPLTLTLLK
jgi:hypothetical protein